MTSIAIRGVTTEQVRQMRRVMALAMGFEANDHELEAFRRALEIERTLGAFDGDQLVGTLSAHSLRLTVPGGVPLAMAGTAYVSVLPSHRRRGIMTQLMRQHLDDARARGEPLAGLWASESPIYGRFGYGVAARQAALSIARPFGAEPSPIQGAGDIRIVDRDEARAAIPMIYRSLLERRPGMIDAADRFWDHLRFFDPPFRRGGVSALHAAIYTTARGTPSGFALFRRATRWEHNVSRDRLIVVELLGSDADCERALWQFFFGFDLVHEIEAPNRPSDDLLPLFLDEPRRIVRVESDSLWLRLVDVGSALQQRRYAMPLRLSLAVRDPFCPWNDGVYLLDGDATGARCTRTRGDADLSLSAEALATCYLGGERFQRLARAGRVQGTLDALVRADASFAVDPAPWCPMRF